MTYERAPRKDIDQVIGKWRDYLRMSLPNKATENDVEALMAPISRDWAWVPLGGSGSRLRVFMIDDHIQAQFHFDGEGFLVFNSVSERKSGWLKAPDGTLFFGYECSEDELPVFDVVELPHDDSP